MSEFQVLRAAVHTRSWVSLGVFLAGAGVVFVGALHHAVEVAWGRPPETPPPERVLRLDWLLAWGPLALLLILGVWMPAPLGRALVQAAMVLGARP